MKNILSAILLPAVVFFTFSACKKDKNEPTPTPLPAHHFLGEGYNNGMRLQLFSDGELQTGYEKLYAALFDSASGDRITEAVVTLKPMMNMGAMMHSAPAEDPTLFTAVDQYFPGAVVFTMPGTADEWSVKVTAAILGNVSTVSIPVVVTAADPARTKSFTSAINGATYFVALIQPRSPIVGINDLELAVYKKAGMMDFPADSSMSITMAPEMPSMGHGSPNNVHPTHTANGHYKGKVNFTMTGLWRLNLGFHTPEGPADTTTYFEISF